MKEYIEREALLEDINEPWKRVYEQCTYKPVDDLYRMIVKRINRTPAADVKEVKHGEWILKDDGRAHCSLCNTVGMAYAWSYCPNCGAKMDGGKSNAK